MDTIVSSNEISKDILHDWVERETRALDVVASWESLCSTYRVLEFSDPLNDSVRLEEFKWIIKQMNAFLTRQKKALIQCKDQDAMMVMLSKSLTPDGKVNLDSRKALAFQKLRQQWVMQMMSALEQVMETEGESDNGWSD